MPIYKGISNAKENNIDILLQPSIVTSSAEYFPEYNTTVIRPISSSSDFINEHVGAVVRPVSSSANYINETLANITYSVGSDYCTIYTPPVDERPIDSASIYSIYTSSMGGVGWSNVGLSILTDDTGSTYISANAIMSVGQRTDELYSLFNVNTEYSVDYDFAFNFKDS